MQIAVIGTGNVGNALLHALAPNPHIEKVLVMSRHENTAIGAIMEVASANPKGAEKMHSASYEKLSDADIIVSTAGVQMQLGQTAQDVLAPNVDISKNILKAENIKNTALIICLATPVDDVTWHMQRKSKLPSNQVFGFGGDLDRNRLEYVLGKRNIENSKAKIVGEHGRNTIPVYPDEKDYANIASEVRGFLGKTTKLSGHTRNLATGTLLAKLVNSVITDAKQVHYVCGYHKEYRVYLTWPFIIGREGILRAESVELGPRPNKELEALVTSRKNSFSQKICSTSHS